MIKITEEIIKIVMSALVIVFGGIDTVNSFDNTYHEKEIMTLYIDKINVQNKIYSKDSILNDIDLNVMILPDSDYPDIEKGTVLLGGHSGVGDKAYFQRMTEVELGDLIRLNYDGKEYTYKVDNISKDNKDGKIRIDYSSNETRLIIYTCYPGDKDSYLVLSSTLEFTK